MCLSKKVVIAQIPKEAANHARVTAAVAQNVKNLREDPTMENTYGGVISNAIAQMPKNVLEAITPVIGQSAMFSEIYTDTAAGLRKDHPDWSEDQIKAKAAAASLPQDVLQELVNAATLGMGSGVTRGITNPVARIAANSILHGGITATAGTAQQAVANVATGRPVTEGLPQVAVASGIQGIIGGAISGRHPAEAAPEAVPRVNQAAPLGEEPVTPPTTTGPAGAAVHGATAETMASGGEESEAAPTVNEPSESGLRITSTDAAGNVTEGTVTKGRSSARVTVGEMLQAGGDSAELAKEAINNGWNLDDPMPKPGESPSEPVIHPTDQEPAQPSAVPVDQTGQVQQPASVTQEAVSRRAYELHEERTKSGQPGTAADDWVQAQRELSQADEPPPATVSEAEPINSAIANRYVQERMATGELGQIDPSQGQSTKDMVLQGMQMSRDQRDGLIKNFMKGQGGDLDQQGAAIRAREAILSEQARSASRAADADPTNPQLQAQAKATSDAVTAFHNGPIKKFKQVWSDAGRALQREIPLDYTTLNGMKEAYLKGKGNGKEAPPELEPKLKQMADAVNKSANREQAALNNGSKEIGQEIQKKTRGKPLPNDDQIRTRLMEIMKDLPCRT